MIVLEYYKILNFILILKLSQVVSTVSDNYKEQPEIKSDDGKLLIRAVSYRNITFRIKGDGGLFVNSMNILNSVKSKKDAHLRPIEEKEIALTTQRLRSLLESFKDDLRILGSRFAILQNRTRQSLNTRRSLGRIRQVLRRAAQIENNLIINECQEMGANGTRCKNGGNCFDGYKDFHCECPNGWTGKTCEVDIDECYILAGTDLGCQNNADCINTLGSYSCSCHTGFYGSHCKLRNSTCDDGSKGEMCGHGICVNANNDASITCICDQGWTKNQVDLQAACNIDVNECDEATNPCHDECINLPGSFKCSACPSGYTGNGVFCIDIDECAINNGGCSMQPKVSCINTEGSYHCGSCPTGWEGDGRICESTAPESCELKNICHPSAKCDYISNIVVCTCPPGMFGHGFGADGCRGMPLTNPCTNHTCQNNATCEVLGSGTRCICSSGYMGPTCNQPNACHSKPCHNGGTCTLHLNNTYKCECPLGTTGPNCEIVRDICGSIIKDQSGFITYPPDGGSYLPNERCAWLISTADSLILNITFLRFDLETAADCNRDWLQLHDGRSLASRLIGRFCGDSLPLGGNIETSQNALFFWFRSDNENNGAGFNLTWSSVTHTCGGIIDLEGDANGIIRSPGYPGKTPSNRECEWRLNAPFGYRFLLRFFEINLGSKKESNCTLDTLKIFDSDQLLRSICETSLIEPLHSSSNTIHLHLHTDSVGTDSSFQLHYEVAPSAPNCGGVFTEPSGIITGYINGRICLYLIQQPIDTKIKLDFTDFNLLKSDSCAIQSVEVYDGSTDEKKILKRLCGNQTEIEPIISSSNAILIRYEYLLPGVVVPKRFEVNYERICETEIGNGDNGIFTTPNYPNPYLEHMDCTFTIRGPVNTVVHINFTDFSISRSKGDAELDNDLTTSPDSAESSVDVYLSKNTKRRYYDGMFLHLVSEKNLMQVVFHGGVNKDRARGIRVEYSFQEIKCGGIVTGKSGHISHSAMTGTGEENCEWVIEAPKGEHIQLDLMFLREDFLKCQSGEMDISIYSNDTAAEGRLLMSFCNAVDRIRESFYTSIMTLILHMKRNRSVKLELNALYEIVDNNRVCGGEFRARYGLIKTPSWPSSYDDSMNCTWIIIAPLGHKIELVIRNFSLEAVANNCNSDYLEIRNGENMKSPLIGKYCGHNIPPRIPSFTNRLYLHFVSDSFISDTGFYITWEQTETGCGGKLNSPKGSIHSPYNLNVYRGTVSCDWQITISRGSTIIIKITSIAHNICNQNLLMAYDGLTVANAKLKFLCANNSNTVQLKTSSNQALIVYNFAEGGVEDSLKFFIDYETDCNVELDNLQGVIESPNFPETYPPGLNCFWDIHGGQNNKFQLIFSHLDIELRDGSCDFDYIDVVDLHNDDLLSKQRLCSNPRKSIITAGNRFQIKFETDYSEHATGFRLEYKRIGCGEYLTGNIGVIKSPNAPYSTGLNCDWHIEVAAGKVIILNFDVIHIETDQEDCREDGIIVSDEKNSTVFLLKECRVDPIPVTVTSTANHLHIHFYTSNTRLRKYIRGTYTTHESLCGGVFRANSGRIRYPHFGDISGISTECIWAITVENSYGINLLFDNFNISCSETFLGLWKIVDSSEQLIEKVCGNNLPTSRLIQSNKLKVVYKASSSGWGRFSFQFKKVCGGLLNDSVGYIKSRLYENCEWKIEAQGTQIFLDILKLECDCSNQINCTNNLKLADGNGKNELHKFCDSHQSNIILPTNSLLIYTSKIEFIAKYSIVQSSCGGVITSIRGILTSPFYPQSYPSNVECVWEIKASAGNSINFIIDELDIAKSENCNEDFLEIRQSDQSGKVLRLYCSKESETEDLVIFEKAWIKFRSVQESTGNGFKISWNYAHNNELNSTMGSIESPPLTSIRNREAFTWRILLPRGNFIFIKFLEYNKGLKLYDGFDETALEVPILESPWQYTSSSNVLYLTSNNNELETFKIIWRTVNNSVVQTNVSRSDCNNTFVLSYESRLNISSPGYPYGYANNLDCEWILKPEDPTEHIILNIYEVKLEPFGESDYLRILSSTNLRDWHKELDISDSNDMTMLPIKVIHGTPYLKLVLHTDSSFNRTGFTSIAKTICGSNMTGITGQIMLKNVISPWSSNLVCKWHFEVSIGKKMLLRFDYSNKTISKSQSCRQYAIVYDGFDYNAPILSPGHICNQEGHNVKTLKSSTNRLVIKYNLNWTNPFERDLDFSLTYQEIGDCDTEVQLTHYVKSVTISSPNYPNVPNPHTDCNWIIIGPVGETLQAEFSDRFSMNTRYCDKEFVEIFDGSTELSHSFGRFCTKPNTIRSTGNILRLHYLSDTNEPRNGFRANVSIANCGGTFTTGAGEISSTGYPTLGAYPKPSICEYTIKMIEHSRMRLNFSDIDLPYESTNLNRSDRIDIISLNENQDIITLYGNTTLPPLLDLYTNKVVLRFVSFSGNRLHRGFKLTFKRLFGVCFRDVNNDAGILTFSTMGQIPLYFKCKWQIRVPKGQRVTFEFLKFEAQSSANTTERFIQRVNPYRGSLYSKISFYNDPDLQSKITEANINNFNFSQKIQSSDNYMCVIINLNHIFAIRTLKARYSSNDESYCPLDINAQVTGSIDTNMLPANANFFCTSRFVLTGTETITFMINELLINRVNNSNSHPYAIRFTSEYLALPYKILTENTTGLLVSLSYNSGTVNMLQNDNVKINRFTANFYRSACGGKLDLMDDFEIVFPPKNFINEGTEDHIECAWMLTGATESRHFQLLGNVSFINDCSKEYIHVHSGTSSNMRLIAKICHNSTELLSGIDLRKPLTTVLFHTSEFKSMSSSSFEIKAETSIVCGGEFMVRFTSPRVSVNSKTYKNNMECSWEFKTIQGLYMSVNFFGRFFIEKSANCSKDYLEIYGYENEIWQPIERFCGRDIPVMSYAATNRMLILFRTDNATTGDGFTFGVSSACKATFNVTDEVQTILTPNKAKFRLSNLHCDFTFLTNSDKGIYLHVKRVMRRVVGSSDTFTAYKKNKDSTEIKIGEYVESREISEHNYLRIVFSPLLDLFTIDFQLNSCGGNITQSTIIRSLSAPTSDSVSNSIYADNMNCEWNVMAPLDHSVLIRFKYFDMENTKKCIFDFVSIYSGSFPRAENELVKLCGNLTEDPPLISVDGNRALIKAVSDNSNAMKGFMAEVVFVRNCNERIAMTNDESVVTQPLVMIRNYTVTSTEELHCQIRVTAPESYRVKIQMRNLDINKDQCLNAACAHCNYVEVIELSNQSIKPISMGKFCSNNETKRKLITSYEDALLQFSFTKEGKYTIEIILEIEKSACGGRNELELQKEKELIIKFPSDDSNYSSNNHCKWRIRSEINNQIRIHFEKFLLQKPSATTGECADFLRIDYGTGANTYCGNATGFTYLRNNLRHGEYTDLAFHSDDAIVDKGFIIKISSQQLCNRTHTKLSGNIHFERHDDLKKTCLEEIRVPDDYFINLHMRLFTENHAEKNCSGPKLQMKEPDDINFSEVHTETDSDVNYTPECSTSISLEKDREAVFEATSLINRGLEIIGVSPIQKKKVNQKRYSTEKMQNVSEAISGKIFGIPSDDNVCLDENDGNEILQTLKDAFATTSDRAKQVRILTICKDWPHRKIQHHFPSATVHMITVAKKIAEEKGILAEANPKSHPSLEREVIDLITQFYELDENSRVMPGKKDFVSVKINNERIHVQKRLLLINLRELHQMFKENHPTVKCSFSKFATLRPKHCVLAGSSGTHSVCVCTIHENVKLLVEGPNIKHLTAESVHPIKSYQDCLKRMLCLNASTNCYFGKCAQCPGATNLIDEIRTILEDSFIEEITYRQWVNVDRTTLQVMVSPVDEYLQKLESGLKKLLLHSFIVKSQNKFINSKKESLPENECIVLCDFSENYAFVVQNSAQGIHWNNNQATIHPFAIYYKHGSGEIRMKSFVVISDCLHHNTIAVHLFQKYLVEYVKNNFENISKITYFSDGASAQYKNKKNFVNLTHHQKDFGLSAEWHFFPTSHGKNACDGLGGTLKRLAARASLQRANNPIQTPKELFDWAIAAIPNISFKYVENEEYYKEEKNLEARFKKAVAVKGTLAYHCMIPVAEGTAKAKFFSLDDHSVEVQVMK